MQIEHGRTLTLARALKNEYRLTCRCLEKPDFYEVRCTDVAQWNCASCSGACSNELLHLDLVLRRG